jgi:tRNA pseudouridine38-40 synthase
MKFALLIEYDGGAFSGWQVQPAQRTVQAELQDALARLTGNAVTVFGAGRTDAGVHAAGMVAHVELDRREDIPNWKLLEALNALTPEDIVIRDVREVPDDFHARYTAIERSYRYRIARRTVAIGRGYVWQVWQPLEVEAMKESLRVLLGEHDFTSFSKRSEDIGHYRCTVSRAELVEEREEIVISISANRFVRGMVRALVGGLVEVGKGKLSASEYATRVHEPHELHRAKFICPPQGLTFLQARYPEQFGLW